MDDADRIEAVLGRRPRRLAPVAGGDIARGLRASFADGTQAMVKFNRPGQTPLTLEARMLADLAHAGLPVPDTLAVAEELLILAWIPPDPRGWDDRAQHAAGAAIARLHAQPVGPTFGLEYDTAIGTLVQPNRPGTDWPAFHAQHRLLNCAHAAHAAGRLPAALLARVERLAARCQDWGLDGVKPSLLHGDLWGGNMLPGAGSRVWFIDPAIYRGHAEVDLAMALLFDSVGEAFFDGYRSVRPVEPAFFKHRCALYQLSPLLVHVALFGGPYVEAVAGRLARLEDAHAGLLQSRCRLRCIAPGHAATQHPQRRRRPFSGQN